MKCARGTSARRMCSKRTWPVRPRAVIATVLGRPCSSYKISRGILDVIIQLPNKKIRFLGVHFKSKRHGAKFTKERAVQLRKSTNVFLHLIWRSHACFSLSHGREWRRRYQKLHWMFIRGNTYLLIPQTSSKLDQVYEIEEPRASDLLSSASILIYH